MTNLQMEGIQMSRRMNYGTRFGQSAVSAHHTVLDDGGSYAAKMAIRDARKMKAIVENMPLHAKELAHYKKGQSNHKRVKAKNQPIKDERLEAERRMLEAMRHVVSTLEFHLEELHRTRKTGNEKGLVNQFGIHNALVLLRTKCGVRFDPNEYDHHLHIAEVLRSNHRTAEQIHDETVSEREQQRLSRLRNMKAIAERFITKHRSTTG